MVARGRDRDPLQRSEVSGAVVNNAVWEAQHVTYRRASVGEFCAVRLLGDLYLRDVGNEAPNQRVKAQSVKDESEPALLVWAECWPIFEGVA
jgi:hypothetical protein